MSHRFLIASAVVASSLFAPTAAQAATRPMTFQVAATGPCQAALPSYEGLIRKRPLALQNEGSANAFVTCSPASLQGLPNPATFQGHGLYLVNVSATAQTVTCTAVLGGSNGIATFALPISVTVGANGSNSIFWMATDGLPTDNGRTFNASCNLPPGTGITTVLIAQELDVGT